ncbi:MFS transporter [Croceivirga thetidis]|uniref:MFS transporter n=1 Tax=Croceivirga thetidis TaxID=2721623 RepID=A0ABX1GPH1_9FLAO|nr:MFS transporter [Croceivirga thetidis]NKI31832.1 MFS transporter [Croceivirga thetidis]
MKTPKHILPIIVLAQFCCTSLWFASNAVMLDLVANFGLSDAAIGNLTSAVQFGFISGTLLFAIMTITDRFSPSRVFFICALFGALCNAALLWPDNTIGTLLVFRYLTGFFLAGIYPVGMKIAADYYDKGLGTSLGYLVGALVVGTSFPHLLKNFDESLSWQSVISVTSVLAFFGGLVLWAMVPNGPFRKRSQKLQLNAFFKVFQNRKFKTAAFGYFGHMWELYTFWAFTPFLLQTFSVTHATKINIPLWSFVIIGVGGLACVVAGYMSTNRGPKLVARSALLLSGICCLLLPLFFLLGNQTLYIAFLVFWGMVVIADSPLFSTMVAQNAIPEFKGTALTIVNCLGYTITIISIQFLSFLTQYSTSIWVYTFLVLGPIFGLYHLFSRNSG